MGRARGRREKDISWPSLPTGTDSLGEGGGGREEKEEGGEMPEENLTTSTLKGANKENPKLAFLLYLFLFYLLTVLQLKNPYYPN